VKKLRANGTSYIHVTHSDVRLSVYKCCMLIHPCVSDIGMSRMGVFDVLLIPR